MPQGPGYLALPTIDSVGSDSPGGNKDQPRVVSTGQQPPVCLGEACRGNGCIGEYLSNLDLPMVLVLPLPLRRT